MTTNMFSALGAMPAQTPLGRPKTEKQEKREIRWPAVANPWDLSPHQVKVLQAYVNGLNNERVSKELCLSPKTVSTHLTRARESMGRVTTVMACLMWDRFTRAEKPVDVEVVLLFKGGKPSVTMREVKE